MQQFCLFSDIHKPIRPFVEHYFCYSEQAVEKLPLKHNSVPSLNVQSYITIPHQPPHSK